MTSNPQCDHWFTVSHDAHPERIYRANTLKGMQCPWCELARLETALREASRYAQEVEDEYRKRMGYGFGKTQVASSQIVGDLAFIVVQSDEDAQKLARAGLEIERQHQELVNLRAQLSCAKDEIARLAKEIE